VLRGRVRQGRQDPTARKPVNKALQAYQEEALTAWIRDMRDRYLLVTPGLLEEMAILSLERAGAAE
jgi:superfamily II DNA or RNA helicase